MATAIRPISGGRVVGALACQRDSYLRALETEVVLCTKATPARPAAGQKKKKPQRSQMPPPPDKDPDKPAGPSDIWLVEFADSVLFPEGGGQPSDHGTIVPLSGPATEPVPVRLVQRQGLRCIHHSPVPLSPGTRVRQEVDFGRRWHHMQQHTGQHLLSAVMDRRGADLATLGWGMGAEGAASYVDLPRRPTPQEMAEIQHECNEVIRSNVAVAVHEGDARSGTGLPADYDREKGVVRVVAIGDIDQNPCCGTHLAQTSHVSLILLHLVQAVNAGRHRLYFSAGRAAIELATASVDALQSIGRALSTSGAPDVVAAGVARTMASVAEARRREKKLLGEIAAHEADRARAALSAGGNAWVYRTEAGDLDILNLAAAMVAADVAEGDEGGVVVLAAGAGHAGGGVVIVGGEEEVARFAEKAEAAVRDIKGGGRGGKWQGKVAHWRAGEVEALERLVRGGDPGSG